jgi:hypothetical protein
MCTPRSHLSPTLFLLLYDLLSFALEIYFQYYSIAYASIAPASIAYGSIACESTEYGPISHDSLACGSIAYDSIAYDSTCL